MPSDAPFIMAGRRIGAPQVFSTVVRSGDLSAVTAVRGWIKKVATMSAAGIGASRATPVLLAGSIRAESVGDPGGFDAVMTAAQSAAIVPGSYAVDFEYQLTGSADWHATNTPAFVPFSKVANA